MHGRLTHDAREAVVPITLLTSESDSVHIQAVIDTGFTGHLTLPPQLVAQLGLAQRGVVEAELADGRIAGLETFETDVQWEGLRKRVLACQVTGSPLVGMSLLLGTTVTMHVVPDGSVTIDSDGPVDSPAEPTS